jgi:hypothetical protein
MTNPELRLEIFKLCDSFASAAQTGNKLVIDATGLVIRAKVLELFPDDIAPLEPTPEPATND